MVMSPETTVEARRRPGRWRRRRWVWLAAGILSAEVVAVVLLSGRGLPDPVNRRGIPTRFTVLAESPDPGKEESWGLLMSPAVLLMPSGHDFSGRSWLSEDTGDAPLEAFLARVQPLPFLPVREGLEGGAPGWGSGLGERWMVSSGMKPLPEVPAVSLPVDGRVRILEGFEGWRLAREVRLEPLPEGILAQRAVVRVAIDRTGLPASPPILWESSGESVADQAAVNLVRRLEWVRVRSESESTEPVWGLVAVTWPAPRVVPVGAGGASP